MFYIAVEQSTQRWGEVRLWTERVAAWGEEVYEGFQYGFHKLNEVLIFYCYNLTVIRQFVLIGFR